MLKAILFLIFGGLFTLLGSLQLYSYIKRRNIAEKIHQSKKEQREILSKMKAASENPATIDRIVAPLKQSETETHKVLAKLDALNYEYGQKAFYTTLGGIAAFLVGLYLLH